jgi:hypothetical protein
VAKGRVPKAVAESLPIERTMAAVLAVLIAERDERLTPPVIPRKTEVILADAGLAIGEIALLTGKNYGAVQMAITRSKRPKRSSRVKRPSKGPRA